MRRSQELPPRCPKPTHELLQLLTRPWTMHILWVLSTSGPTRFGALRRQIDGISSRLLTERLRDLEEKSFIYRHYEPTIPPAVTYGLTKRVQEIRGALAKLDELADKWQEEDAKGVRKRKAKAVWLRQSIRGLTNARTSTTLHDQTSATSPVYAQTLSSEVVLDALKMILLDAPLNNVLTSIALLIEAHTPGAIEK